MAWLGLELVATRRTLRERFNSAKEGLKKAPEDRARVLLELLEAPIGTVVLILSLEAIPIGEVEIDPPIITTLNTITITIIRIAHRWLPRNTITIIFSTHRSNTINNRKHGVQRRTME